jgi:hypothetical protein
MDIYQELQTLLASLRHENVCYALCGGLALAVYGITRATQDIDLMVEESALPRVRAVAERLGFRFDPGLLLFREGQIRIQRMFKTDYLVLGLLLVTPLTESAWRTRQQVETEFGPVTVVSPAGLIGLKSLRQSGQDQDDIRRLKELTDET